MVRGRGVRRGNLNNCREGGAYGRGMSHSNQTNVQDEILSNSNHVRGNDVTTMSLEDIPEQRPSFTSRPRGINHGTAEPANEADRIPLEIVKGCFIPVSVSRDISVIIKNNIKGVWENWSKVPVDNQEDMWKEFKAIYKWIHQDKPVKDLFLKSCKRSYSRMFNKAREMQCKLHGKTNPAELKGLGPSWLHGDIWNKLVDIWSTEEWKHKSEAAKRNKNTVKDGGLVKHTAGSISFVVHEIALNKKHGKEVNEIELYDYVHMHRDENGTQLEFVDSKSKRIRDEYTSIVIEKYGPDVSSQPSFDPDEWKKIAKDPKKKRIYGFGSRQDPKFIEGSGPSRCEHGDDSSHAIPLEQLKEIEERIRQDMRHEMEDEIARTREELEKMKNELVARGVLPQGIGAPPTRGDGE